MPKRLLFASLLGTCLLAQQQFPPTSGGGLVLATFAAPPSHQAGKTYLFTDANGSGLCAGGGTSYALCYDNGTTFSATSGTSTGLGDPGSNSLPYRNGAGTTIPATATQMSGPNSCQDAGATDTYACNLSPALASYVAGTLYWFKANTANTGACSINFNSLGALPIKKTVGGITTDPNDNDIRAGQWVGVFYDGTNAQMATPVANRTNGPLQSGDIPNNAANTSGTSANVTGIITEANGGTGLNNTPGAAGHVLRSNGTHYADSAIQAADVPTLNQSTTGTAANVTGVVAEANGGTGSNNTPGSAGHVLRSNGTHYVDGAIQAADVPTLNQNTTGTAASSTTITAACTTLTGGTVTPDFTGTDCVIVTANANVTVNSLTGQHGAGPYSLRLCNDTTARTWTIPANLVQYITPDVASTCVQFPVWYDSTTTNYKGDGSNETPSIIRLDSTRAAPGTPSASKGACWLDSSNIDLECMFNNSANVYRLVLTGIDVNPATGQVTATHLASALPVNQGGSGTTSTLSGIVRGGSPLTASELSGDCTTSGSNAVTCTKINGTVFSGTTGDVVSFGALNTPADAGFLATNVVRKDAANTGAAAMTLDLSGLTGAGAFRVPNKAGAAPTANGVAEYDITNKNIHWGANGVDNVAALFVASSLPTNGDCMQASVVASMVRLVDAGGPCTTGGGGGTVNSGTAGNLSYYATSTNAVSDAGVIATNVITDTGTATSNALMVGGGAKAISASTLTYASNQLNSTTSTQALTFAGGADASANSALGGVTVRGANQTGAGGASSQGGGALVAGGSDAATNTASVGGTVQLSPGGSTGASSTGLQGLLLITQSYAQSGTVTQWNLECFTATAKAVTDCGASPTNIAGVAFAKSGSVQVSVAATPSEVPVNASAAVTIGHTVCAGATAGQVTDSGGTTACATGITVGVVIATSGTWPSWPDGTAFPTLTTTLPLIRLANRHGVGGGDIVSSVALAGNPTTTTQSAGDNSTKIATTAYVDTNAVTTTSAATAANQVCVAGGANKTCSYIDFPDTKYVPAANCNNATPGAGWSIGSGGTAGCRAGTNNKGGYLTITGTSSTFGQFLYHIPKDWSTGVNPYIEFDISSTDTTNGHTIIPQIQISCPTATNGTVSDDATFASAHSATTITIGGAAVSNGFYTTSVQMNGTDTSGCVAGGVMIVQVGRATDTATSANFYGAALTFPRRLVVQAN